MIGRFHAKELIDSVELKDKFKNGELLMHDINENNGIFEIISFDKDFDNKDQIIRIFCH